ncbi:MAG TPA: DUF5067 domain-containing protein [Candidatus Limiplasma sp.]|nr:DUF5067 domain-containing protein [Candidatus Limiplasma sp.]
MKRIVTAIITLVILLFCVTAFADYDLSSLSDNELLRLSEAIKYEQEKRAQEKLNSDYIVSSNLGDYFIGLKTITFEKDWSGNTVALLTFDFSHSKNSSKTYYWNILTEVYQDGAECSSNEQFSSAIKKAEIKPGALVEIVDAFTLWSKGPFDIEISQVFSFSNDKLLYTYTADIP